MKYTLYDAVDLLEKLEARTQNPHLASAKSALNDLKPLLGENKDMGSLSKLFKQGAKYVTRATSDEALASEAFNLWAGKVAQEVLQYKDECREKINKQNLTNIQEKKVDGETVTKWLSGISLFLVLTTSIVAMCLNKGLGGLNFDLIQFVIEFTGAVIGALLYVGVFVYNHRCSRKCCTDDKTADDAKQKTSSGKFDESKKSTQATWFFAIFFVLLAAISFGLIVWSGIISQQDNLELQSIVWNISCICGMIALFGASILGTVVVFCCSEIGLKKVRVPRILVVLAMIFCIVAMILQIHYKPLQPQSIEYVENGDGTYEAVIIPCENATDYVIAADYNGKPITSIGRKNPEKQLHIKTLDIGVNVKSIGEEAFAHSRGLMQITLPINVAEIGDRAFYDCTSLASATISCNLRKVGNEVFEKCDALTTVSWNNDSDGVVYGDIFASCEGIRTVILGQTVKAIAINMFNNCKTIEQVVLYENIKSIEQGAFTNCDNLQSVFYRGSKLQWNTVDISSDNDSLKTAQVYYYSQQEPQLSDDENSYNGNYWHFNDDGLPVVWKYIPPTYTVKFYADGKLCKETTYIKNHPHIEEPAVPLKLYTKRIPSQTQQ